MPGFPGLTKDRSPGGPTITRGTQCRKMKWIAVCSCVLPFRPAELPEWEFVWQKQVVGQDSDPDKQCQDRNPDPQALPLAQVRFPVQVRVSWFGKRSFLRLRSIKDLGRQSSFPTVRFPGWCRGRETNYSRLYRGPAAGRTAAKPRAGRKGVGMTRKLGTMLWLVALGGCFSPGQGGPGTYMSGAASNPANWRVRTACTMARTWSTQHPALWGPAANRSRLWLLPERRK